MSEIYGKSIICSGFTVTFKNSSPTCLVLSRFQDFNKDSRAFKTNLVFLRSFMCLSNYYQLLKYKAMSISCTTGSIMHHVIKSIIPYKHWDPQFCGEFACLVIL